MHLDAVEHLHSTQHMYFFPLYSWYEFKTAVKSFRVECVRLTLFLLQLLYPLSLVPKLSKKWHWVTLKTAVAARERFLRKYVRLSGSTG
jgi:hypothetical protein